MKLEDLQNRSLSPARTVSWVGEIPAIAGCYALTDTREADLAELSNVLRHGFRKSTAEKGPYLPCDTK